MTQTDEIIGMTRDELRHYALDEQRLHDPEKQGGPENNAWAGRCKLCHYTRHPCEVYDLATAVLFLLDDEELRVTVEDYSLDEGRTDG